MPSPIVQLSGATFRWPGQAAPIMNISELIVPAGERLFVHGPSGSGKTTLLNLLAGVTVPQAGTVVIFGQDMKSLSNAQRDAFRADHIGLIFQMFNLVPYLSMDENVLLPCRFSNRRRRQVEEGGIGLEAEATRLLKRMGLDGNDLKNKPVSEMSVGQQQRVAAARALIGRPELVIADEPTSALDADVQEAFLKLLVDETKELGTTLIFVSHDQRLSGRFDRVLALSDFNNMGDRDAEGIEA